jgi:hypothetical protein
MLIPLALTAAGVSCFDEARVAKGQSLPASRGRRVATAPHYNINTKPVLGSQSKLASKVHVGVWSTTGDELAKQHSVSHSITALVSSL